MGGLRDDSLRRERRHLVRALKQIAFEEATGLLEGDRDEIKELLMLRIAEIDRLLGPLAEKE